MSVRGCLLVLSGMVVLGLAGCGSSDESTPVTPRGPSSAQLRDQLTAATRVQPDAFPPVGGRSLQEVADALGASGPQLAFATSVVQTGEAQRLAFGIIDQGTEFVYAPTVVYLARKGAKVAQGPFAAPADLLVTDSPFRSQTAASEEDPFAAIYDARITLDEPGTYQVLTASKVGDQLVGSGGTVDVRRPSRVAIPDVGEPAPRTSTETVTGAGGDIESIDTRRPNDSQHDVDFRSVVGRKPVALLFATPQLCESRVCGPVVDIAEQLKRTYGDRMTFIHQEVFVENRPDRGLRAPLRAFSLETEPWLFTVDASGKVAARLEGSFGFAAFESAIKAALK